MEEERIAELERELYTLRNRVEKNELRIKPATDDIKQIWMFVKNYLLDRDKRIGNVRVSKKTIAGIFVSLAIGIVNFFLRLFDII